MNNLKTKENDLDVGKWKSVPVDSSDEVDNEVLEHKKFNTQRNLDKKNSLDNKIPDATTLIHINQ